MKEGNLPVVMRVERCAITAISAIFPEDMEGKEWKALWPALRRLPACVNWIIGDWQIYGRRRFGEKYAAAMDITQWEYQRLANVAHVASHVAPEIRRENLDWSHHVEVASLPEDDQRRYLAEAEEKQWTVSQLRCAIRASQATRKRSNARVLGFVPAAWAAEGLRWFRQQDFDGWSKEQRGALRAQLRPIVEVFNSLPP